jgi:hypothetical protein
MRFTAEDAFDAQDEGEPIMVPASTARRIVHEHAASFDDFTRDAMAGQYPTHLDAAVVLAWLGY